MKFAAGMVLIAIVAGAILVFGSEIRDERIIERAMLPVDFKHVDHNSVGCADCHHNFVDHTGMGDCYRCHKSDAQLARVMQDTFHRFCRDCHVNEARQGNSAGPLRACDQCHRENDAFM